MSYSPILGTVTAALEIIAGGWVLGLAFRSGADRKAFFRLIAALLFLLAGYQVFEVLICTGPENRQTVLSRMAFLDITWLPPLSLLLIGRIAPRPWLRKLSIAAVALAAVFSFWIIVDTRFITGTICEFMVARYRYVEPYFHLYGAYYELTQMSIVFIPAALLPRVSDAGARAHLGDVLMGALLYLLPSLFLAAARPNDFNLALPSIMCHFAIFFAVFLAVMARRESLSSSFDRQHS